MKKSLISLALVCAPLLAMADVNVSINLGQPDFYGLIELGNAPRPVLIYNEPRIITPGLVASPPLYLRVPADHYRDWGRYCGRYNACGRKVYFVQDNWYKNTYAPWHKAHGGPKEGRGWRKNDRDDRGYDHDGHDGGKHPGKGNKGHGKHGNRD